MTLTFNKWTIINETVSARNPPPICIGENIVDLEIEVCLHIYDIDIDIETNNDTRGVAWPTFFNGDALFPENGIASGSRLTDGLRRALRLSGANAGERSRKRRGKEFVGGAIQARIYSPWDDRTPETIYSHFPASEMPDLMT
ncbi:hypothetical protein X777_11823 [Ooceraea biroi]|uniref:Uncharacterized protein n=1 Tax=Ooceraea biroi TaxID=2015173 RepID=A0A026W1A1_OOCBI|nr:hypothetical protein X777_11823 [Ooceraea biroi]